MDKPEILNKARQAGIEVAHMLNGKIRTDDKIREQWVVCFATMIEESTKEKAAKVCEETEYCSLTSEERPMLWFECAAAIRSMK